MERHFSVQSMSYDIAVAIGYVQNPGHRWQVQAISDQETKVKSHLVSKFRAL